MPLQFYKPNSFNSGSACSFSINSKGGSVYVEIVKQISWDKTTETGVFFDREKKEKGENVSVQLDRDELGDLIYAIQRNKPFKAFHESEKQTTRINFEQYAKWNKEKRVYEGEPIGWGLSIGRKSKEKNEESQFKIPFTFGESIVLLEYFRFALEKIFSAIYSEDKQRALERQKQQGQ